MRTKKALLNTVSTALLQVVTIIVGFVIPRLIIEVYGSSVNGLRASISQFIGYLYIIEMGLAGAIIYALYKPLAQNNITKINAILSTAKKSYNHVGFYFSILVLILVLIYPFLVTNEGLNLWEIRLLIFVIGLSVIINYFTVAKYNVLLTAAQCNYAVSIMRIVYLIINTFIIVILINLNLRISIVFLIALLANIIQVFLTILYTKKHFNYISFNVDPDLNTTKKRFDVLVHQVSEMIVQGTPIFLLTLFCTLEEVSVFSVYLFIFLGITMILAVFQTGFSSGFGHIIAQEERGVLETVYSQFELMYYILLTSIYVCTFILGMSFIKLYTITFTDANYINLLMFYLFIIFGIVNNWKKPQSTIIFSAGHFKETRKRAILQAVITFVTSILLVIWIGMEGVIIGSIIGHLYRSIDMYYSVEITKVSFGFTIKRLLRNLIAGVFIIVPCVTFISIDPKNYIEWFLMAFIVFFGTFLILFTINFIFEKRTILALIKRVALLK